MSDSAARGFFSGLWERVVHDFKTPPDAVRSGTVRPAKLNRVQTREEAKAAFERREALAERQHA